MPTNYRRHDFESRPALAEALAATVASALNESVETRGGAMLAVSGGSTPTHFFEALSQRELDWSKVTITLIDERYVPETSPRSNAALVRGKLLKNNAATAEFRPLYRDGVTIEQAAEMANNHWDEDDDRCDVVVLGMGNDGHTASFFPDATNLNTLLNPNRRSHVDVVYAQSAGEPRLTMTLAAIIPTPLIALQIEGEDKAATLKKALAAGSTLPIKRIIDAAQTPVEIFWAP